MSNLSSETRKELAKLGYEERIQEAGDRKRFEQEIGVTACKSVILVNSGAIISLLTFIGNQTAVQHSADLKQSIYSFSIGIGCALFSLILGYLGQDWLANFNTSAAWNHREEMEGKPWAYDVKKERDVGWGFMVSASAFVMTGIGSFIYGAINAANSIL